MLTKATVNYHIRSDDLQAYHIDAGGVEGVILSPTLVPTTVNVQDVRSKDVSVSFLKDSITFAKSSTSVRDFEHVDGWQESYNQELATLLVKQIGAKEVIVFDHTIRIDDPNASRKPARNVHGDYSASGAQQRLTEILGEQRASQWREGHFGFVNVWRPIGSRIESTPLGFIRPDSVHQNDWQTIDLVYPNRKGEIMGLVPNARHQWIYLSKMDLDEVAIFNVFDNKGLRVVGHSALDVETERQSPRLRKSIESRTLVRY